MSGPAAPLARAARRLGRDLAAYVADLAGTVRRGWRRFFFEPADPTPLGLMRALVGALLVWDVGVMGLDLRALLSSDGWFNPATVRDFFERQPGSWAWSFWMWVPDRLLPAAWVACLVVLALFALGLGSRLTAVLAWAIVVSTARRMPAAVYGLDNVASTWMLYLAATGASGQAFSLDRLLARRRGAVGPPPPTVSANLALRLVQLHLALIYGISGLAKLQGFPWWNGTAAAMVAMTPEFRRFDLTWLAAYEYYPYAINFATHAGLFLEVSYPALIWVRVLRPLILVAVAMMHFGIDLALGLTEFGLMMLAGNLAFVSGPWIRGLFAGRDPARAPSGGLAGAADRP